MIEQQPVPGIIRDGSMPVRQKIGRKRGDDWHKYATDAHRRIHRLHGLYGLVRLNGTKSLTKPGVSTESAVNVRGYTIAPFRFAEDSGGLCDGFGVRWQSRSRLVSGLGRRAAGSSIRFCAGGTLDLTAADGHARSAVFRRSRMFSTWRR